MPNEWPPLLPLAVGVLGGLAVGIEREWSGKSSGPHARFAGLRTFTLLGIISTLSGWLWTSGLQGPAAILLGGAGGLVVVAYAAASRRDVDGTTEVAAIVVLTAGVMAGAGATKFASGIIALTVLLLVEKKQLHGWVSKLDREELRAGARFAVMAAVILPLLPPGPYGPLGGIKPRTLWALVLFFSGLSFVGYIAQRAVGRDKGHLLTGTLGGLLSSTSVTLTFSRLSAAHPAAGASLAAGTMGANVLLFPRILAATAVLAPELSRAVWPAFIAPAIAGTAVALIGLRRTQPAAPANAKANPLQLGAALQMAGLFQIVLYAVAFTSERFGQAGIFGSAAVLGLVDMDALTVSMSHVTKAGTSAATAAQAIVIGVLANTVVKLTIALVIGRGIYRVITAAGLILIGAALAAWSVL
ncbi:MAG TPA: MgtC/SapB family protein [Vicinamibacterales bacterium]|nr:MgtC/SapB family protein [Vicinamibacterales bacterium]